MSVEAFPQKLFCGKEGQGTNLKTTEGILAAIYTPSAHRSFGESSTKGPFALTSCLSAAPQPPTSGPQKSLPQESPRSWDTGPHRYGSFFKAAWRLFFLKNFHGDGHCAWRLYVQACVREPVWGLHALPLPSESGVLGSIWTGLEYSTVLPLTLGVHSPEHCWPLHTSCVHGPE